MAPQSSEMNQKDLHLLSDTTTYLQDRGGIPPDEKFWTRCAGLSSLSDADTSLEAIRRLESMRDTLSELVASCEKELEEVKRIAGIGLPVHRAGLQNLPIEVLASIFKLCVENDGDNVLHFRAEYVLPEVCQRFRALALNIPSLWTRVVSSMPTEEVTTRLQLSKLSLLTIIIDSFNWTEELELFITLVSEHSTRWKTLRIEPSPPSRNLCENLPKFLGQLQLPRLESLIISPGYCDYSDVLAPRSSEETYFVDTPNLRHIRIHERFPGGLSFFFTPRKVRVLEFLEVRCGFQRIAAYISSLPDLTELRLSVDRADPVYDQPPSRLSFPDSNIKAVLPRLKKLSLECERYTMLPPLFSCFRMPKLEYLKLTSVDSPSDRSCDLEKLLSDSTLTIHSIKEVNITHSPNCDRAVDFSNLFERFPNVERVNVASNRVAYFSIEGRKTPPLRSISLESKSMKDHSLGDLVQRLVQKLKKDGKWYTFEFFELKDRQWAWKRDVEEMLTKGKVRWID